MTIPITQPLEGEVLSPRDGLEIETWANPFSSERLRARAPEGLSISEIVSLSVENPRMWKHVRVWVMNAEGTDQGEVPRDLWSRVRPRHGTKIVIKCIPAGGGGGGKGKQILAVILTIIVLVFAWYLAPVIGGAIAGAGASATAIAGATAQAFAALSTIGMALVRALIPPPKPNSNSGGGSGTQRTFAITGTANRAAPFEAVPRCFGRMRLYPPLASAAYNEISPDGTETFLRMLLDLGPGPLKLSSIRIGDTPIENFQDVQIEVGHTGDVSGNANPAGTYFAGFSDDRPLTLYPTAVIQTNESVKILQNDPIIRSFGAACAEGRVVIAWPTGLYGVLGGSTNPGAHIAWSVVIEAQYREVGTGTWIPMLPSELGSVVTVGGGRNINIADNTNASAGWDVRNVPQSWDDTDYLTRYPTVNSNYNPTVAERTDKQGRVVPKGLWHYAQVGLQEGKTPSWVNGSTAKFAFMDMLERNFFSSFRTPKLVTTKSYEFRLNRTYGFYDSAAGGSTKVFIGAEDFWLSSIQSFKAESPVKNVQNHALMALRIRSSEQLNGSLQSLNMIAEALLPVWNGSSWVANQITRNPAWAYAEILRGVTNARVVSDARLDLPGIKAFADWCAGSNSKGNPRAMFDGVFDTKNTVLEALQQVLAVQRASFAMRDGKFSIIYDAAKTTPIQLFTPRNSSGFSGKKAYIVPPHALKVRFINELKNYVEDELTVFADGYTDANATVFEQIETFGITRAEQAHWFARYMIATNLLRPELYTIEVDIEGLVCRRGDLVRVQHDVTRWGIAAGHVKATTDNGTQILTVTLDETFLMEAGKSYAIRGRLNNGTVVIANVNGVGSPTDTNTVTLTTPVAIASMVAVGDLVAFGEVSKETTELLVRAITRQDDLKARLQLVDYSPDVFTSDIETIPAFDTNSTWQGTGSVQAPPIPVISQIVSDESVLVRGATGYVEAMEVRLANPTGVAIGQVRPDDYIEIRYARTQSGTIVDGVLTVPPSTGSWFSPTKKFLGNPGSCRITDYIRATEEFKVQARRVTLAGLPSDWSAPVTTTIVGRTTPPANVTGFIALARADDVLLSWSPNVELDIDGYELRVGASWAAGTPVEAAKSPTTHTTQYVLAPLAAAAYTYWIKAVDTIGLLSTAAANVMFTISAPSQPSVSFLYQGTSVGLTWADCQTSHRIAFYRVKKGAAAAVEIKTTNALFPVDWTGSLAFEVWAVDIAGNESTHATVTVTNTGASAPANFVSNIISDSVALSWDVGVPGSLPIASYELRYGGTNWNDATFLANVLTTTHTTGVNWSGSRTFRLKAKDTAGNYGTEATRAVNIVAPTALVVGSSLSAGQFTLSWTPPTSTLPIKEYEIRYGASYAAGTPVAILTALSFSGNVDWTGTRSFWIVARTTTGLGSTATQKDVVITGAAAPALIPTIVGPNAQITWGVPSSSLPISRYEVRVGGADWASATFVAYVDTTLFVTPVTWSGTRTYRISAIDTALVTGAAGSADFAITAHGQPASLTADVVDNNVLLRWSAPATGSLPVDYYRVRYGATWGGASVVGDKTGTFTSHFQTLAGTFLYWVAAVDTAGNEGVPRSLSVVVNTPPDYVLKTNFNSALGGTLVNAILDGGIVYMPALTTGRTWQQHFDDNTWTTPQDQITAGYPIYIQPTTGTAATYQEVYDFGSSIPSATVTMTATYEVIAGTIVTSGKLEKSSDGSSWTDVANPGFTGLASTFRYIRMTFTADATDATGVGRLLGLNLRIDLKQIGESGVKTCNSGDSGGTTVTLTKTFLDIDAITVTPRSTTACYAVVDFTDAPNPTTFKILVFDTAGTRVTKDVGWEVSGV